MTKLTIIESPFAGDIKLNIAYARLCLLDSIQRHNEVPTAAHLLYPQVLDDTIPEQRAKGLKLGDAYYHHASNVAVYLDLGLSSGMKYGIGVAHALRLPISERRLFPALFDHLNIVAEIEKNSLTLPQYFAR